MTNKEKFLDLLSSVYRSGMGDLLSFLNTTDFDTAPASAKYHNNKKGGLLEHSLNVYNNILKINELYNLELNRDSMILVALLHDLAKVDFYELYIQNRKDYNVNGKQFDAAGNFDWIQVEQYRIKDSKQRNFTFGEHGVTSYVLVSKFIKLTDDEIAAIINHHMGLDNGKVVDDISEIYNRYPLAAALHVADTMATYFDENHYRVNE